MLSRDYKGEILFKKRKSFVFGLKFRIKGDHAYRFGVKVGDSLLCTTEPDNKHSDNAILVKSGNDDIVGHVPETLAKKLFNFMKTQQIEIIDSEVTGNPRPAPEGAGHWRWYRDTLQI